MKELELLKKDWKKQDGHLPKIGTDAIYKMIHKGSSSLTKWILIIGLLEFAFWIILTIATSDSDSYELYKELHVYKFNGVVLAVQFIVLAVFLYLFYKNYRLVSTTEDTKQLMERILKVRRTVNCYVIFNLGLAFVSLVVILIAAFYYNPEFHAFYENNGNSSVIPILIIALFILGVIGIFWLFYKLLYGILLRKLNRNYKELSKLEMNA